MALKNTAPVSEGFKAKFNWVTQAGASTLRNLPFGGALGVVAAGIVLWLAPQLIPEGWSAEAVLSLGMGAGVVVHRLFVGTFGWFIEPMKRHLGSRWEAWIQLGKLERLQQARHDRARAGRTCSPIASCRTTSRQRQRGGASRPPRFNFVAASVSFDESIFGAHEKGFEGERLGGR